MAEGFARFLGPADTEVFSAGSAPSAVNPWAVRVMKEVGIDISAARSKSVVDIPRERVGLVVTLCSEEECPTFLGDAERVSWALTDPAAAVGSDDRVLAEFRRVRDEIRERVSSLF